MTALVVALAGLQLRNRWRWELWGGSRGWDRVVSSFSSLVSHANAEHLANNLVGGVIVLVAVELLVGRRWFLFLVGASAFDAWAMTSQIAVIQGCSGLVLASAGLLLSTFPQALAGLKRRDMTRLEQACFAATLISVSIPVVEFVRDLQRYGADDGVAHGVHMRAEVFGVLLGAGLGCWRWYRSRALERTAQGGVHTASTLLQVPDATSCSASAVRR